MVPVCRGWDDETLLFFFQSSDWIHAIWQLASVISHHFYFWTAQSISKANSQAWIVVFFFWHYALIRFWLLSRKSNKALWQGRRVTGHLSLLIKFQQLFLLWAQPRQMIFTFDRCRWIYSPSLKLLVADARTPRCGSPAASSPDPPPRRTACTRSGSARYSENDASPDGNDKPSGKRKFKSKHLSDSDDQKVRLSSSRGVDRVFNHELMNLLWLHEGCFFVAWIIAVDFIKQRSVTWSGPLLKGPTLLMVTVTWVSSLLESVCLKSALCDITKGTDTLASAKIWEYRILCIYEGFSTGSTVLIGSPLRGQFPFF